MVLWMKKSNTFSGHSVAHTPSSLFASCPLLDPHLDLYCLLLRWQPE